MAKAAQKKDPAAVALGRRGGKARVPKGFAVLSAKERMEAARAGAEARWGKKRPNARKNA